MDDKRKDDVRRSKKGLLHPIVAMVVAAIIFAVSVGPFVVYTILLSMSVFLAHPRDTLERAFEGFTSTSVPVAVSIILWLLADIVYQKRKAEGIANAAWHSLHHDPTEAAKVLETLNQAHKEHVQDASSGACRACVEILDAAVGRHDPAGTANFLEMLEEAHRERMSGADPAFHPHYTQILAAIQEARKGYPAMSAPALFRTWPTDKR